MRKIIVLSFCCILALACKKTVQTQFSEAVLNEKFIDLKGQEVPFKKILSQYHGKQIVIDVWASWCKDCIVGFPELKSLQNERPEAVYLFLSADRNTSSWQRAIKKYQLQGTHYFLPEGTKGKLGNFVDIDWIPRYMIVDSEGRIELFEAIEADDPRLKEILKN
ncbi:TlpA family protein disulfide reductase [Psychroserpens sp. XS_ASV72]|uniref:TlpA family protein disulfide reductase n=1 Tax=Psychroserpens sp. XS_ASV72 TaxID=3241293 RepID=UPI0035192610